MDQSLAEINVNARWQQLAFVHENRQETFQNGKHFPNIVIPASMLHYTFCILLCHFKVVFMCHIFSVKYTLYINIQIYNIHI